MGDKIKRLRAERVDLRDELDKAKATHRPAGKRKAINRLRERLRAMIARRTVRIRKLVAKKKAAGEGGDPTIVLTRISPNKSARSGSVKLIVLHSTESTQIEASDADLAGVASWFANPSAQVSAHVITDSDGHSARCVEDNDKAWHCGVFNSAALGIEQIGRASQTSWAQAEADETARWIALWCRRYGIPCQRGAVSGYTVTKPGIVTHADLGAAGGGHSDPGAGYSVDAVIDQARKWI